MRASEKYLEALVTGRVSLVKISYCSGKHGSSVVYRVNGNFCSAMIQGSGAAEIIRDCCRSLANGYS